VIVIIQWVKHWLVMQSDWVTITKRLWKIPVCFANLYRCSSTFNRCVWETRLNWCC